MEQQLLIDTVHQIGFETNENIDEIINYEAQEIVSVPIPQTKPQAERKKVGILGISSERQFYQGFKSLNSQITLLPHLEKRFQEKCSAICSFFCPPDPQNDQFGFPLEQIDELPIVIEGVKRSTKQVAEQQLKQWTQQDKELQALSRIIDDTTRTVHEILSEFKTIDEPRAFDVKSEYLRALAETMQSKVQLISLKLLLDIYTVPRIREFEAKKQQLKQQFKDLSMENKELEHELQRYRCADSEYQELATEFSRVLEQVHERQEWLSNMKSDV